MPFHHQQSKKIPAQEHGSLEHVAIVRLEREESVRMPWLWISHLYLPTCFPVLNQDSFGNQFTGYNYSSHILISAAAAAAAKSLQSCPTLWDPIDGSPPGSPVPGILQARTLEWDAISFSNAWKWKVKVKSLSCVRLLATPWTAAYQAPPSMGFSRQEYWSGVPLPSPMDRNRRI